ncbi:MAG: menaquinol-cytochrome c reductase cytochrome b subunit, partial [Actinomycetota bacterium]
MPTPDEVFDQVLAEETAKGSSPAVAQARAKAARVRAQRGAKNPSVPDKSTAPAPSTNAEAEGGAAAPAAKRAVGNGSGAVPERVQRLLAVVKPEAIQKVERQPMDRVNVWPHLMAAEMVSLLVVLGTLTIFSIAVDAPLRELSNFNQTPNPSKAPWYFLGLQELLRYFHPQVAGVTIPTVIIIALIAAPYVDRTPSTSPDDRKFAIVIFSFFMLTFAVLPIIGMFFRGPG